MPTWTAIIKFNMLNYKQPGIRIHHIILLFIIINAIGCRNDRLEQKESQKIIIQRLDREIHHAIDSAGDPSTTIVTSYPEFAQVYFQNIAGVRNWDDQSAWKQRYINPFSQHLFDTVQQKFPQLDEYERQFGQLFSSFERYIPEFVSPTVFAVISEFEIGAFTVGKEYLGIGLDFYLGSDNRMYDNSVFPDYIKTFMTPDHLVPRSAQVLLQEYLPDNQGNQLIDYMLYQGKLFWAKEMLMPQIEKHVLFEYTPEQYQWLEDNESEIWGFLLREELLYSTDYRAFQKLIDYSPTGISGMPAEAPGRVGNYIGYKIVSSTMDRNKQLSLQELFTLSTQEVMNKANYKPKRSVLF